MPDVIEKLVELLGNLFCGDYGINGCDRCKYNTEVMCSAYACADHLIVGGVTIQRWISVTERLPAPDERVLACTCNKVLAVGRVHGGRWVVSWNNDCLPSVTHWMPLPEAPKEDEDD